MRNRITITAIAVVAAASVTSIASAGGDAGRRTLELTARNSVVTLIDLNAPGASVGDREILTADLYRGDRKVGRGTLDCGVTATDTPLAACLGTATLPGGQLTFYGEAAPATKTPAVSAVTGGTGRFATARGEAILTVSPALDSGSLTIRLR